MASPETDNSYVVVAAIDFGTTFSGYAFSFKNKPKDIHMNKNWGESIGHASYKTPTSVLTDSNGQFVTFGHEAETKYGVHIEDKNGNGYELYRHFKMLLHNNKTLSKNSKVEAVSGKTTPAMDIFVMAIKFLKDHLLSRLKMEDAGSPSCDLIKWVITVPAIWTEEAKQFMRDAVYKAGCIKSKDSKRLVIALEPEAASFYCRNLNIDGFSQCDDKEISFKSNTKYLVIDAGGGTVDITAHKVLVTGDVEELHVANGGGWGGIHVDSKFVDFFKEIFGADFINSFKANNPFQWFTCMDSFEKAKKGIKSSDSDTNIRLPLNYSFAMQYNQKTGKDITSFINSKKGTGIEFKNGIISIYHVTAMKLFKSGVENVIRHLKEVLKEKSLQGITYAFLVGGFGESRILQQSIKDILPREVTMLVPSEAQLSVVKGAVEFGHNTDLVRRRIARKTYGTYVMHRFDKEKHDPNKKYIGGEGEILCDDIFEIFVKSGEKVEVNSVITKEMRPVKDQQDIMKISIYSTERNISDEVVYVDAPGIEKIGSIHVNMPNKEKNLDREVEVQFLFGGTEIQVSAKDIESGCTAETVIDFLAD